MPQNLKIRTCIWSGMLLSIVVNASPVLAESENQAKSGSGSPTVTGAKDSGSGTSVTGSPTTGTYTKEKFQSTDRAQPSSATARYRADHPVKMQNEINRKAQFPSSQGKDVANTENLD